MYRGLHEIRLRPSFPLVDERAYDLVTLSDLVGYDWITPDVSEKVAQKEEHFDRLYLYPRDAPPIVLGSLGEAVYPLMTFVGRVVEYQSQKVLRRKLDDDVVETLGRCLLASARGPFFTDEELRGLFGRGRESVRVVAGMWPRMNLAAPELRELLTRICSELVARHDDDPGAWDEWIEVSPERVRTAAELFRRVSTGEV